MELNKIEHLQSINYLGTGHVVSGPRDQPHAVYSGTCLNSN